MNFLLFHGDKVFLVKVALTALILWLLRVQIPWPFMIVIGVLVLAWYLVLRIAVVPVFRRQITDTKDKGIEGQGRVVEPLTPVGLIKLGGEYWKAQSIEGDIEVNESVEVVGQGRTDIESYPLSARIGCVEGLSPRERKPSMRS